LILVKSRKEEAMPTGEDDANLNNAEAWAEIHRLMAANKLIEALKIHRAVFRTTLKEAKEALEERKKTMKTITKAEDMFRGKHFVILEFSSYHVPGDQRSRDAPGHGYHAHDVAYTRYMATQDKREWEREIAKKTLARVPFVAFVAGPLAEITTHTKVEVTIGNTPT
jgi:hypothetical protein